MNARAVLGRWIGVPLLAALLALLGTLGAQAQDPALAEPGSFLIRPGVAALDVYCGVDFTNEDPYMWVDATDAPCPDLAIAEVRDIQITGNVAWATVVVGDETELHVYLNKDGAWERFPYVSAPDAGTLYMLEQENAFVQQQNPGATAASPSAPADPRSSRYTVNAEADFLNMLETESAYEERFNPGATASIASPNASADLGSSRYTVSAEADFLNMLETENAYEERFNPGANPSIASPNVSVDPRGENYWTELLAGQEGAAIPSGSEADLVSSDVRFTDTAASGGAAYEEFMRELAGEHKGEFKRLDGTVSIDPRGENYWNEWLAGQEGSAALTPPSITVSPDSGALSAGALEPEIHVLNGSKAKTLADLLAELFGSTWPGQLSAGEDLTRELE
jgi:hypothetical protein